MIDRFFSPDDLSQERVTLRDSEAHHLIHVLRAKPGLAVEVFNGQGLTAKCIVLEVSRRDALLHVEQRGESPPVSGPILLTAIPKGERLRWLIEKATELGVERVIPVLATRGTVAPREAKLDKLEQTVIAACKQSRRDWLMRIEPPMTWNAALDLAGDRVVWVAHPAGAPFGDVAQHAATETVAFGVGPEGGFTDDELAAARSAGAQLISLGDTILRTETAGIALASWWRCATTATSPSPPA